MGPLYSLVRPDQIVKQRHFESGRGPGLKTVQFMILDIRLLPGH